MFYLKQSGFTLLGFIIVAVGFILRSVVNDDQTMGSLVLFVGLVFIEESLRNMWKYKRGKWPTSDRAQSPQQ